MPAYIPTAKAGGFTLGFDKYLQKEDTHLAVGEVRFKVIGLNFVLYQLSYPPLPGGLGSNQRNGIYSACKTYMGEPNVSPARPK